MSKTSMRETESSPIADPAPAQGQHLRCPWASKGKAENIQLLQDYHDREWGVPLHDDNRHFELLLLEWFQAGLSWLLILQRRMAFRQAFSDFDPARVALYSSADIEELLGNSSIIRHRAKIEGAIHNAGRFLTVQEEWGSFDVYIWHFTEGKSLHNVWHKSSDVPSAGPLGREVAHDLKRRGFQRLGPVTTYAYLQAIGVVNDHLHSCFRYAELTV
ncbi:MAG: DNA-3-methyladenine glycosylase I [Spirochaetota bacterium]